MESNIQVKNLNFYFFYSNYYLIRTIYRTKLTNPTNVLFSKDVRLKVLKLNQK